MAAALASALARGNREIDKIAEKADDFARNVSRLQAAPQPDVVAKPPHPPAGPSGPAAAPPHVIPTGPIGSAFGTGGIVDASGQFVTSSAASGEGGGGAGRRGVGGRESLWAAIRNRILKGGGGFYEFVQALMAHGQSFSMEMAETFWTTGEFPSGGAVFGTASSSAGEPTTGRIGGLDRQPQLTSGFSVGAPTMGSRSTQRTLDTISDEIKGLRSDLRKAASAGTEARRDGLV